MKQTYDKIRGLQFPGTVKELDTNGKLVRLNEVTLHNTENVIGVDNQSTNKDDPLFTCGSGKGNEKNTGVLHHKNKWNPNNKRHDRVHRNNKIAGIIFIDMKQTYDKIRRLQFPGTVKELDTNGKLVRLNEVTLHNTENVTGVDKQ